MFKFLLIAILAVYVLVRIGKFFFTLGRGARFGKSYRRTADHAEKNPPEKGSAKGGEYIDFEEVK